MVRTAVLCALVAAMTVGSVSAPATEVRLASSCSAPSVAVGDFPAYEGTAPGSRTFTFLVTIVPAPGCAAVGSVQVGTLDGTAVAPGDYQAASTTVTWNGDTTPQAVTVAVLADPTAEPDEYFRVALSNPVGVVVTRPVGVGTVLDDDDPPQRTGVDGGKICWSTGPAPQTGGAHATAPRTGEPQASGLHASGSQVRGSGGNGTRADEPQASASPADESQVSGSPTTLSPVTGSPAHGSQAGGTQAGGTQTDVCSVPIRTNYPPLVPITVRFRTIAPSGKAIGYEPVIDGLITIPAGRTIGYAEIRLRSGPRPAEERFIIELSSPSAGVLDAPRATVTIRSR